MFNFLEGIFHRSSLVLENYSILVYCNISIRSLSCEYFLSCIIFFIMLSAVPAITDSKEGLNPLACYLCGIIIKIRFNGLPWVMDTC